MNKHFLPTLTGALSMFIVFLAWSPIDMYFFGADIYTKAPFTDWTSHIGAFLVAVFALKIFHAGILSYLHESIPKCACNIFKNISKFAVFAFLLTQGQAVIITALTFDMPTSLVVSWAISGFFQILAASLVMVPMHYKQSGVPITVS